MWNNTDIPLAYFITFHTYGTWLHGDCRGSIDRAHNRYESPRIPANPRWHDYNRQSLRTKPLTLGPRARQVTEEALRETCRIRKWSLFASNVRTNHVHVVLTAQQKAKLVRDALKANATRRLREEKLWLHPFSPWVRKGSLRRLWTERSLIRAIEYVLYEQ